MLGVRGEQHVRTHTHTPTLASIDAPLRSGWKRPPAVRETAERIMVRRMDASVHRVIAQVIPCQGCCFQRFEILKAQGVKGRRPLENQGNLSISTAKIHQKLSWIKEENEVQFA